MDALDAEGTMTTKTITWVADDLSPYESNGKTTYYINVAFDDESTASLGKQNQAKAAELRSMLVALKGQPSEFGLKDKNSTNAKGKPKYKIESFPGYEPAPYDPGAGGGGKSWYNSEEGVRFTQDQMNRRTAVMQAVEMYRINSAHDVVDWTETFYGLLGASAPTTEAPVSRNPGIDEQGGAVGGSQEAVMPASPGTARTSAAGPGEGGATDREPEGLAGTDPKAPTPRHDQLWSNLVDFAGGKVKALNLVNKSTKSSYKNAGEIPETTLEDVIRTFTIQEYGS